MNPVCWKKVVPALSQFLNIRFHILTWHLRFIKRVVILNYQSLISPNENELLVKLEFPLGFDSNLQRLLYGGE